MITFENGFPWKPMKSPKIATAGVYIWVETGPGYPGQPGQILSGSNRFDPVYKISGCDQNSVLDYMH